MYGELNINIGHRPNNINGLFNGFRRTRSKGTMTLKLALSKQRVAWEREDLKSELRRKEILLENRSLCRLFLVTVFRSGTRYWPPWNPKDKKIKPIHVACPRKREGSPSIFPSVCSSWGKFPIFWNRTDVFLSSGQPRAMKVKVPIPIGESSSSFLSFYFRRYPQKRILSEKISHSLLVLKTSCLASREGFISGKLRCGSLFLPPHQTSTSSSSHDSVWL